MRDYVAAGMALPPGGINAFAPRSRLTISFRTNSMRMATRSPMRQILARQFQKSDGITLKDYRRVRAGGSPARR